VSLLRRPEPEPVLVVRQGDDLMMSGRSQDVALIAADLSAKGIAGRPVKNSTVSDAVAAGVAGYAFGKTHTEYFQLSKRSLELLAEFQRVASKDGYFHAFVRDKKHIKGLLEWKQVSLAPEQALSIQMTAASIALRVAIKEVVAAVERVEGKVDDVLELQRTARVGDVLGDRRMLAPLMDALEGRASLSATDWSTVAAMGAPILHSVETLRGYIRGTVEQEEIGWFGRAGEAEGLARKELLHESIQLLVVAEDNLMMWHRLRLAHIQHTEPEHLAGAIADARKAIDRDRIEDEELVQTMHATFDRLTSPNELDGLVPFQVRRLKRLREELSALTRWFAEQRSLDLPVAAVAIDPTARTSLRAIARRGAAGAATVRDVAGRLTDRRRQAGASDEAQSDKSLGEGQGNEGE
jgi:hypothetical protein